MTQQTLFGSEVFISKGDLPPIDIIISGSLAYSRPTCCIISEFGFKVGLKSDHKLKCGNCRITFMDNPFMKYNHEKHISRVMEYIPKYATIRDYFNTEQCKELGIEYYTFDQLKEHGEILKKHNVIPIIIPKFEAALDEIDTLSGYVVGYSMAGKFGKAKKLPLDIVVDRGYKIHLLGGRHETQIDTYLRYPDSVVSMDSSVLSYSAIHGEIWEPINYPIRDSFKINKSTLFKWPGLSHASLASAMSLTNLYNYIAGRCN